MSAPRRSVVAAALAAVLACGGDDPTSPRPASPAASEILDGLAASGGVTAFATNGPPPPVGLSTTGGSFASGRDQCPPVAAGDFTVSRWFEFRDAAGAAQRDYDPASTASVTLSVTTEGRTARPNITIEHARTFTQTASGLLGEETERVIDGTGTGSTRVTSTTAAGFTSLTTTSHDTTSALRLPVPAGPSTYPRGGSVTAVMRYSGSGGGIVVGPGGTSSSFAAPTPARIRMTFDESSVARVELTFGGITRNCTLDMANRAAGLTCPGGAWVFPGS